MKKYLLIFFFILLANNSLAEIKENIIQNLLNTNNISFNFEQNINGKIESGNCIIDYSKKIYCTYDLKNKKILVSHTACFKDDLVKENKRRASNTNKAVKEIQQSQQQSTLGDIEGLSALKDDLDKEKK